MFAQSVAAESVPTLAFGRTRRHSSRVTGRIDALFRHPVKGFTPERLTRADLIAGEFFSCDRLYAVENGPSGFDPEAPAHISKSRFTVLAQIADVARISTRYDEASEVFRAEAPNVAPFAGSLAQQVGRAAFAHWLEGVLPPTALRGPLKVVSAPGHRFTDSRKGFVSVLNLASVRDLAARIGQPLDPLRFRANVWVEGWAPWAEMRAEEARLIQLGGARCEILKPIVRCVATHVDPYTGVSDIDVIDALRSHYGHLYCGLYVNVTQAGAIHEGDVAEFLGTEMLE